MKSMDQMGWNNDFGPDWLVEVQLQSGIEVEL